MLVSLHSFFEKMDKSALRDVYARTFAKKGLVNNTSLLKELLAFYGNAERFPVFEESLEAWQKRILFLIAASGTRGVRFRELRLAIPVGQSFNLSQLLEQFVEKFYVWKSKGSAENVVYRAFSETFENVFAKSFVPFSITENRPLSYKTLLDFHICRILSLVKLNKIKMNAAFDLQRRSTQICNSVFMHLQSLFPKGIQDELMLILQFLTDKNWFLLRDETEIVLSDTAVKFLEKNGFRLHQEFCHWWLQVRFQNNQTLLSTLLEVIKTPRSARQVVEMFWPYDPSVRLSLKDEAYSFERLPRLLREMWLIGLVDFYTDKQKNITAVVLNENEQFRAFNVAVDNESKIFAEPNFEISIPSSASPRILFYASSFAKTENDEMYLRFRFERETFAEALQAGFSENEVQQFLKWINFPKNVRDTLEEWAAAFFGASFFTGRILKIEDSAVLDDLSSFPQFMNLVLEKIPHYGFLIKPEFENDVRILLGHYGLTPALENGSEQKLFAETPAWSKIFALPWPSETEADISMRAVTPVTLADSAIEAGRKKYGVAFFKADITTLVQALRYAKSTETLFTVRLGAPGKKLIRLQEKTYSIRALRLSQEPFVGKVLEVGQSEEETLELSQIREICLLHKKSV